MNWKYNYYDDFTNFSFCMNIFTPNFILLNTSIKYRRMFLSTCFNMNKPFLKTCLINKPKMKGAEKNTLS